MSKSDNELDVIDVISFMKWMTIEQIMQASEQSRPLVKRVIKDQIAEGYLEVEGKTYRYFNSTY